MQIALYLAYDGSRYFGSQIQPNKPTIQGELEKVLHNIQITSPTHFSGRTDKGVHASMQVVSLELPSFWKDTQKLKDVLNKMLPLDIRVQKIKKVEADFHARYSAKRRVYRYIISTEEICAFRARYITYLKDLNFKAVQEKIKLFEGEHNFSCFIKTGSETKTNVRHIYKAFAYIHKNNIILYFEANGFLRTQIRFMVGALLQKDSQEIKEMLLAQKCKKLQPAPSNGLYLAKIKY